MYDFPMKIVICGSMSAAAEMLRFSNILKSKGHTVVVPENIDAHANGHNIENAHEKMELDVFKNYYEEIEKSDAVLVVNETKGDEKNYVGPNSLIEMAFAYVLNKKIFILHAIPDSSIKDEVVAMNPIELKGDISGIA